VRSAGTPFAAFASFRGSEAGREARSRSAWFDPSNEKNVGIDARFRRPRRGRSPARVRRRGRASERTWDGRSNKERAPPRSRVRTGLKSRAAPPERIGPPSWIRTNGQPLSFPLRLAPPPSGVWGLDYPLTVPPKRFRPPPSSLYTFPMTGLARDRLLRGFPEFDGFYSARFHAGTPTIQLSRRLLYPLSYGREREESISNGYGVEGLTQRPALCPCAGLADRDSHRLGADRDERQMTLRNANGLSFVRRW